MVGVLWDNAWITNLAKGSRKYSFSQLWIQVHVTLVYSITQVIHNIESVWNCCCFWFSQFFDIIGCTWIQVPLVLGSDCCWFCFFIRLDGLWYLYLQAKLLTQLAFEAAMMLLHDANVMWWFFRNFRFVVSCIKCLMEVLLLVLLVQFVGTPWWCFTVAFRVMLLLAGFALVCFV